MYGGARLLTTIQPEKLEEALNLLRGAFPIPIRSTYLKGKTGLRDFLYEKLGCSLMEAEAMVDTLENAARIEFKKDPGGVSSGTWEMH
jgi:hypothetical protein